MRILHYSDHGTPEFRTLYDTCDLLVTTGDLEYYDFPTLEELPNKKPAFGVYGNHDSGNYMEMLGIINLHMKVYTFAGLRWGGFQGCLRYKEGSMQFSEEEAEAFARDFPSVDVLLLHAPPFGMLDAQDPVHVGSKAIRRYIEEKQPRYVFCGHLYEPAQATFGKTEIIRGYNANILELSL